MISQVAYQAEVPDPGKRPLHDARRKRLHADVPDEVVVQLETRESTQKSDSVSRRGSDYFRKEDDPVVADVVELHVEHLETTHRAVNG